MLLKILLLSPAINLAGVFCRQQIWVLLSYFAFDDILFFLVKNNFGALRSGTSSCFIFSCLASSALKWETHEFKTRIKEILAERDIWATVLSRKGWSGVCLRDWRRRSDYKSVKTTNSCRKWSSTWADPSVGDGPALNTSPGRKERHAFAEEDVPFRHGPFWCWIE